jgi:hypothetical protein
MQTFLPYADFERVARCLDDRRLGKQRVEAYQVLNALTNTASAWRRHPTVRMWAGYENALRLYMNACIEEWVRRGFKNNMPLAAVEGAPAMPPWLGDERYHASHRANLLRKDAAHYGRFGWTEDPAMPYFWPECPELERTRPEA